MKLVTTKFKSGELHEKHVVATWNLVANYTMHPFINGLSDHVAQIMKLNNINIQTQSSETQIIGNCNKYL